MSAYNLTAKRTNKLKAAMAKSLNLRPKHLHFMNQLPLPRLRALIALATLSPLALWGYDFEVDGIYYDITSSSTVSVTYATEEYNSYGNAGTVVVPETVDYSGVTYTVTAVGKSAFRESTDLYGVVLPATITTIGNRAFYKCQSMVEVNIPSSVTSISSTAFYW